MLNAAKQQYQTINFPVCTLINVQIETITNSSAAIAANLHVVIRSIF